MPDLIERTDSVDAPRDPEVALRDQAVRRLRKKRDFLTHLMVYVLVNVALWAIWVADGLSGGFSFPWPIFPTAFWGIGVVAHAVDAHGVMEPSDERIRREMDHLRRS